jgi:hypothetical protein
MNGLRKCIYICIYIHMCMCKYVCMYMYMCVYTHTMGYYSAIKKNEILLFAGKWMELEIIMISEVSQVQKDKSCMFSLMWKKDPKDKWSYTWSCLYLCVCVYIYTYMHTYIWHVFNSRIVRGLWGRGRGKESDSE